MSTALERALWLIESRYRQDVTLDDVAKQAGLSRTYLSRIFPMATGISLSAYLRGRRLTEAARTLARGAPDILDVALDASYGSHEAFTRAFREQFGMTPEQVRAQGHLDNLDLVEPHTMNTPNTVTLAPPRIVPARAMLLAGLKAEHEMSNTAAAPHQWQLFAPWLGHIPGQTGEGDYGVILEAESGPSCFGYLTAVEVTGTTGLPAEFTTIRLPEQRYLAYRHEGHISGIRATIGAIFATEVEHGDKRLGDFPNFIEYYGPSFDGQTGYGEVEIWLPLKD